MVELAGINIILFVVLVVWSAIWKGVGLWKAGRNNHLAWFLFMFIFNTAGILPIVYIAFFSEKKALKKKKK